jgi:hypothetical protein
MALHRLIPSVRRSPLGFAMAVFACTAFACVLSLQEVPVRTFDGGSTSTADGGPADARVEPSSCPSDALFCATFDDPKDAGGFPTEPPALWEADWAIAADAAYEGPSGLHVRGTKCIRQKVTWKSAPLNVAAFNTVTITVHARRESEIPNNVSIAPAALQLSNDSNNLSFSWGQNSDNSSFPPSGIPMTVAKEALDTWQTLTWTLTKVLRDGGSAARLELAIQGKAATPLMVAGGDTLSWPDSLRVFVYANCGTGTDAAINYAFSVDSFTVTAR